MTTNPSRQDVASQRSETVRSLSTSPSRHDVAEMLLADALDPDVDTVLTILYRRRAERAAAVKARAERVTNWAAQLEGMTAERFDDGMLVIEYVLLTNPQLRGRLRAVLDEAFGPQGASS